MFVARIPNRNSPPAILLWESYREGDKVKSRTLANLSHWPDTKIDALRRLLKNEELVSPADRIEIERSAPHGHVAAVLGMAHKLGLDRLLPGKPKRLSKLALALIVARVIEPAAKLATARQLSAETAVHSLGAMLDLGHVDEDELYAALDRLGAAQPPIEAALAKRHLQDGALVLYDLTSNYLEGRHCELSQHGYSRDGHPNAPMTESLHSFRILLQDLATLTRNIVRIGGDTPTPILARPTPIQQKVFSLLAVPLTLIM